MSVVMAGLVAVLDVATGDVVSLRYLYLLPIIAVTWVLGRRAGLVFAALTVVLELGLDGYVPAGLNVIGLVNASVRALVLVGVVELVSELQVFVRRRTVEAACDSLTGLLNRRAFYHRSRSALAQAESEKQEVAVLFIDLDGFKAVNDTFGHEEGDRQLSAFGDALRSSVRDGDVVGRLGGDEFGLLVPDAGRRGAYEIVGRVVSAGDRAGVPSASVGIVTCPPLRYDLDEALRAADHEMYEDKLIRRRAGSPVDEATGSEGEET